MLGNGTSIPSSDPAEDIKKNPVSQPSLTSFLTSTRNPFDPTQFQKSKDDSLFRPSKKTHNDRHLTRKVKHDPLKRTTETVKPAPSSNTTAAAKKGLADMNMKLEDGISSTRASPLASLRESKLLIEDFDFQFKTKSFGKRKRSELDEDDWVASEEEDTEEEDTEEEEDGYGNEDYDENKENDIWIKKRKKKRRKKKSSQLAGLKRSANERPFKRPAPTRSFAMPLTSNATSSSSSTSSKEPAPNPTPTSQAFHGTTHVSETPSTLPKKRSVAKSSSSSSSSSSSTPQEISEPAKHHSHCNSCSKPFNADDFVLYIARNRYHPTCKTCREESRLARLEIDVINALNGTDDYAIELKYWDLVENNDRGIEVIDEDAENMKKKFKEPCGYCGKVPTTALTGLDRIDTYGPYSDLNTTPACWFCNSMKAQNWKAEFIHKIRMIALRFFDKEGNRIRRVFIDKSGRIGVEEIRTDDVVSLPIGELVGQNGLSAPASASITTTVSVAAESSTFKEPISQLDLVSDATDLNDRQFIQNAETEDTLICRRRIGIKKMLLTEDEEMELRASACYLCGKSVAFGLDRYNASIADYIKGNTLPCCGMCNYMKTNTDLDQLLQHVYSIFKHTETWELEDFVELPFRHIPHLKEKPLPPPVKCIDQEGNTIMIFQSIQTCKTVLGLSHSSLKGKCGTGVEYLGCLWEVATHKEYREQVMDKEKALNIFKDLRSKMVLGINPIGCIDEAGVCRAIFRSNNALGNFLGCGHSKIQSIVDSGQLLCGFKWVSISVAEYRGFCSQEAVDESLMDSLKDRLLRQPIGCFETENVPAMVFDCLAQVEELVKIPGSLLNQFLDHKRKFLQLQWKSVNVEVWAQFQRDRVEKEEIVKKFVEDLADRASKLQLPIKCIDNDGNTVRVYENVKEMNKRADLVIVTVKNCLNTDTTYLELIWKTTSPEELAAFNNTHDDDAVKAIDDSLRWRFREAIAPPVACVDRLGKKVIFINQTTVTKTLNLTRGTLANNLDKDKYFLGYKWETAHYVDFENQSIDDNTFAKLIDNLKTQVRVSKNKIVCIAGNQKIFFKNIPAAAVKLGYSESVIRARMNKSTTFLGATWRTTRAEDFETSLTEEESEAFLQKLCRRAAADRA